MLEHLRLQEEVMIEWRNLWTSLVEERLDIIEKIEYTGKPKREELRREELKGMIGSLKTKMSEIGGVYSNQAFLINNEVWGDKETIKTLWLINEVLSQISSEQFELESLRADLEALAKSHILQNFHLHILTKD